MHLKKKLRNKLKGFEHEKKSCSKTASSPPIYVSIQNTGDIILKLNQFFFKEFLQFLWLICTTMFRMNEFPTSKKRTSFRKKKENRSWWSLGHVPTLLLDPFRLFFFHLRWRHAHFPQFFAAINLRTTDVYCFKCVSKKKGCLLKNCN